MANTVAEINTLVDAACTAIDAGDYATAVPKLEQAVIRIQTKPDWERHELAQLKWDREELVTLLKQIERKRQAQLFETQGISVSKVTYETATD